jgi:antitoxin ParD1/3/4
MIRQSISVTSPNDEWLKAQVESEEYTSKSEVINDLIRKARRQEGEIEYIRTKLLKAEKSGFTDKTATEILTSQKEEAHQNGDL